MYARDMGQRQRDDIVPKVNIKMMRSVLEDLSMSDCLTDIQVIRLFSILRRVSRYESGDKEPDMVFVKLMGMLKEFDEELVKAVKRTTGENHEDVFGGMQ